MTSPKSDRTPATVSVLIMVISLVAAGFAFLQTRADNSSTLASRQADAAALDGLRELTLSSSEIDHQAGIFSLYADQYALAVGLYQSPDAVAQAEATGHVAALNHVADFSDVLGTRYQDAETLFIDWARYYEEMRRPVYEALEHQKAHEAVTGAWEDKASRYVAIITILAGSLFLLSLTLNVASESRRGLIGAGLVLAVAASFWGVSTWTEAVHETPEEAIEAFVDGAVESVVAGDDLETHQLAVERFTEAIRLDPGYRAAYLGRGTSLIQADLLDPEGPTGSAQAVADLRTALAMDDNDAVAWNNYGAAQFWLGDYDEFERGTERALELDPHQPIYVMNLAFLASFGETDLAYPAALNRVRKLLSSLPSWHRDLSVSHFVSVLDVASSSRPEVAAGARRFREDLTSMSHEIAIGKRLFGTAEPLPVDAEISDLGLTLDKRATDLRVTFAYRGLEGDEMWSPVTYLDGALQEALVRDPEPWPFEGGTARFTISAEAPYTGHLVRVEVFIEGNLVAFVEQQF